MDPAGASTLLHSTRPFPPLIPSGVAATVGVVEAPATKGVLQVNDGFLRVENFEKMQHKDIFKKSDGKPPWIKFFVKLLDNEDFEDLDYVAQLAYVKLLLLAARKENAIPNRPKYVAARLGMTPKEVTQAVATLIETGLLSHSKTKRRSRVSSEKVANKLRESVHQEEKRREEKELKAVTTTVEVDEANGPGYFTQQATARLREVS